MDEPNFYCACKSTHVLTGAKCIGLAGTVGCLLALLLSLAERSAFGMVASLVAVPLYLSLLYAHHRHKPRLYLPFLLTNGVQTLIVAVYICFLLAMLAVMPRFWQEHLSMSLSLEANPSSLAAMRWSTALLLGGVVLFESLLCWFQSVVLSAYNYMCLSSVTLIPPTFAPSAKKEQRAERESQLA